MKIATWNVNSLNVRLPHVLDWLAQSPVDALCLQELKLDTPKFPLAAFEDAGWHAVWSGQKTYNGVAIISKRPMTDVCINLPTYPDPQQRVIAATLDGVRIVCAYFPNGQSLDSEKYPYKLAWLDGLISWIGAEKGKFEQIALLGDYNIAPTDLDLYDPIGWKDQVLVSGPERAAFQALLDLGFTDAYRHLWPNTEKAYTWWDYRMNGYKRNLGLRIDHILLSPPLLARLQQCEIDLIPRGWERPSDHTPVIATLA